MNYHSFLSILCVISFLRTDASAYTTNVITKSGHRSSLYVLFYSNPDESQFANIHVISTVDIRNKKLSPDTISNHQCTPQISSEQCAKDLTDFMAKSHEEKLNALKHLKENKDSVIKALKIQLELKTKETSSLEEAAQLNSERLVQLSNKIESAKKFITSYMIKKQEEKRRAIMDAEQMIAKKYERKLKAFMLNPSSSSEHEEEPNHQDLVNHEEKFTSSSNTNDSMFKRRNNEVATAAKEDMSRWEGLEVKKAEHKLEIGSTRIASSSYESSMNGVTLFDKTFSFSDSVVDDDGRFLLNDAILLYSSMMHLKVKRR